ncbi:MAG: RdgB/HAM1 family non-canonical purine NTP pyrophosphatase [Trueperaceae bacterium]
MKLVIATHNSGKIADFNLALGRYKIELLSARDVGIHELPQETGATYEENAMMKAAYTTMRCKLPCLADDSGLEVAALGSAPGIFSARYGGKVSNGERMAYLLEQLLNTPQEQRTAKFVCSLVFTTPRGLVQGFLGETHGSILHGPRGTGGFGYDPIFFSHDLQKSFGEASENEKLRVSHRGRALAQFVQWIRNPQTTPSNSKEAQAVPIR